MTCMTYFKVVSLNEATSLQSGFGQTSAQTYTTMPDNIRHCRVTRGHCHACVCGAVATSRSWPLLASIATPAAHDTTTDSQHHHTLAKDII